MEELLNRLKIDLSDVLSGKLTGIYVHGSLAMGCHNPAASDVDLIVTAGESLTLEERLRLGRRLVRIRNDYPAGSGIELSVVLDRTLAVIGCPTPVEFHYSEFHHARYAADDGYVVGGYEDADLAAQLAVARERGYALIGEPLERRMPPVGRSAVLASILQDVEGAVHGISDAPVYHVLNLCRTLYYCREGVIASKREGGEWGAKTLPSECRVIVQQALDAYNGGGERPWDGSGLAAFAELMLTEIREAARSGKELL